MVKAGLGPICSAYLRSNRGTDNAVSKRIRLAGYGSGNDEQRNSDMTFGGHTVFDGSALLRIERFKI
jgi:hypothetical protein